MILRKYVKYFILFLFLFSIISIFWFLSVTNHIALYTTFQNNKNYTKQVNSANGVEYSEIQENKPKDHHLRKEVPKITHSYPIKKKFPNPIDSMDYPCLSSPLPGKDVLLIIGTTVIENSTSLKDLIQRNTLSNLHSFPSSIYPVLFTNSSYWMNVASSIGIRCSNDYYSNEFGTPFFTSLLSSLESITKSVFIGYMNCDLLFHSSLVDSLNNIISLQHSGQFNSSIMLMGRRYNKITTLHHNYTDFSSSQFDQLIMNEVFHSDQFITVAQDYFIMPPATLDYSDIPDLVIGRNGYDNFLVNYCMTHSITLIDMSASVMVLHQTDTDGNWAGSKRSSLDRTWNLDLTGDQYDYATLSKAPYQLLYTQSNQYSLYQYPGYDNHFHPLEYQFIESFFQSSPRFCLYYGKGSFRPFFQGRCYRFDIVLYDIFQQKYEAKQDKEKYYVQYRSVNPTLQKSQCLNYSPYVQLSVKRATYYDFVLIDGICKQYIAFYVLSRLKSSNTTVLIRGENLFQYQKVSDFILQYYNLISCMDPFDSTTQYPFYGICAYKPKPESQWKSKSLPKWW